LSGIMAHLAREDVEKLEEIFGGLTHEVTLHLATDDLDYRLLMDEVAATGKDKIKLVKLTPGSDDARIAELGVPRNPAIAITSPTTKGRLFFSGYPVGWEMATLVSVVVDAGGASQDPHLVSPAAQAALDALTTDLNLQVFSTPG
jgi:hypothetical protein